MSQAIYSLSITLFGPFDARGNGQALPRMRTRKGYALLALLVLRRGAPVERSWLAGTLWPESSEPQALANLRNSLKDLRRALGEDAHRLGSPTPRALRLDLAGAAVDVLAFEAAVERGDETSLAEAVALYRGPLLEGWSEEWVFQERQVREQAYLAALETLAAHAMAGAEYGEAKRYLRLAVGVDPTREIAQRSLMAALAQSGNYAAATQLYRELRLLLHQEMNAEPDVATRELYEQIREEARRRAQSEPTAITGPPVAAARPVPGPLVGAVEGTITFLFTDIEGSTKLWEQHPEAMEAALKRHDALAAAVVPQHAGTLVKQRGEGDSLFAVFARATDAVAAATALQQALCAEPWRAETPLRVRIALHTGEAALREGDYYGAAVNRCVRLRALAHGGQVLLSQATGALVRDQLPAETGLRDLGAHRLKDLQQPEHVFGLLHPGLPTDFPPLRSLEAFAHNLPSQLTSFIGREQQMAEVKQFLATTRLLTLTGSGGCGKTRLALQVAADLLEEYADGVWLVELAPLTDPALVPQTVASALGAREEPGRSLTATLTDTLRPKSLLMVLDNCEHLLTACAQLADTLLRSCPGLRMLASSREGLGIGGEQIYRVPSLSLPDATHLPPLEGLHEFEAVQLFADRARLGQPAFAVTQANALAVAQVCQRLDGIPLAIELAAARVKVLSVEQIAERLDDRFRLLTGGSRTALPRQQTLRALIDWSYDLLVEPERALLRRSSVFAGGWSLEAAEAVCAGDGIEEWEVLDLLTSLVDKSLASAEEHEGLARYRLLETVRQYARDRLLESGEEAGVRRRHLECFLRLAEEAISWLAGPKQAAWLDRLETEHDNLRAGLEWSRAADERVETGLRLALALWAFWDTRHHRAEAREHLSGLLERSGSLPPAMRAAALCAVAHYTDKQHDSRSARQMVEEGLAIYRRLEDKPGIARALRRLGVIALRQGDAASARTLLEESLDLHRELNKKRMPGWLLWNLGEVSWTEGDTASAQTRFEQSLSAFRANGDKLGIANALQSLGAMAMSRGEYAAARPLFEESLENGEELGSKGTVAESLQALGDLARCQGDWEEARSRYTQSLAIGRELENAWSIARSLIGLGLVLVRLGQYAEARAAARDSMRFWQAQGNKRSITRCLECLAQVAWAQGELVRMARLFGAAEAMREAIPFALHPGNRSEYDGITAARAALGEEAFAAAWAEGRALSLEAAIALALEERGDDPPFDRD